LNPHGALYRKLIYLAIVAVLAFPLAWLGMPSTRDDEGGRLAQLRTEARLGQADLGAIDPASETIRLATLGLRGVAVTMLWSKANDLKKTEDWTTFQATLEQLARLQPYFVKVWQYQSWNLSYNVSVEVDNVRDRFYYVKQGIEYLEDGIRYLRDNPVLLDDLGWFTGNKVGRADEHEFYRRLFRLDDDLHPASRTPEERDNWLVSKEWYNLALAAVARNPSTLGQKNPTTFYDSPGRSQISYAEAIEEEGTFGDRARTAWREGGRLWNEYGEREMKSTEGFLIRLADLKKWEDEVAKLKQELDALNPGLEKRMQEEAIASLTPEQRAASEAPPAAEPSPEQAKLQQEAADVLNVSTAKVAARIAKEDPAKAAQAQRLAQDIDAAQRRIFHISSNREVANYEYWRIRCELEQTPEALKARALAHGARLAFKEKGDPQAREDYEESFKLWAQALAKFPELPADSVTGSDLLDVVGEYVELLGQQDLSLEDPEVGDNFPLWHIVKANDQMSKYDAAIKAHEARVSGLPTEGKSLINPADAFVD
jgi:hypothetical protein